MLPEDRKMLFTVEMLAFGNAGEKRIVEVPENRFIMEDYYNNIISLDECLEIIFRYGQNEVQPKNHPSVSVNDVIVFDNKRYKVLDFGFGLVE